ncbi:MAG: metallophosphoesterase [Desulfosporosinus sp.]|nr:metallophosphoesterase [Desulfosporosinus sp.]
MSKIISILHISDLQFGPSNVIFGETETQSNILYELSDDINYLIKKNSLDKVDLVIVSGDIADTAMPYEYDQALTFFKGLKENLMIDNSRVIMVPGNHDINWPFAKHIKETNPSNLSYKFWPFIKFCEEYYGDKTNVSLVSKGFEIFDFSKEINAIVYAFNSSLEEDHENNCGYIDLKTIHKAFREHFSNDANEFLKIAVFHHSILEGGASHDRLAKV